MKKIIMSALLMGAVSFSQAGIVLTTTPTGTAGDIVVMGDLSNVSGGLTTSPTTSNMINTSGTFGESMVIAADGTGLTQATGGAEWENIALVDNQGSRHRIEYDLGTGTEAFTLTSVQLVASGVVGNGITVAAHYQIGGTTWYHDNIAIDSDGVHTIVLSEVLNYGVGTTPITAFRVGFYEPTTITTGDNAVIESISIIPEPTTLGLISTSAVALLGIRRLRI